MALEVEVVNGPGLVDILVAAGTTGAAVAAAYAAWMANRENKRLTERMLRFRFDYASDPGSDPEHAQLRLTISNDCFRPITVSEVGFLVHAGGSTRADREDRATLAVTTILQDGGFGQWPFEPGRAVDRVIVALEDEPALVEMFARDSHGVRHS